MHIRIRYYVSWGNSAKEGRGFCLEAFKFSTGIFHQWCLGTVCVKSSNVRDVQTTRWRCNIKIYIKNYIVYWLFLNVFEKSVLHIFSYTCRHLYHCQFIFIRKYCWIAKTLNKTFAFELVPVFSTFTFIFKVKRLKKLFWH